MMSWGCARGAMAWMADQTRTAPIPPSKSAAPSMTASAARRYCQGRAGPSAADARRRRGWVINWSSQSNEEAAPLVELDAPLTIGQAAAIRPIAIEALTGFAAEVSSVDQLSEQGGWRKLRIVQTLIEDIADVKMGVEADEIGQLERTHRVMQAELCALVDVFFATQPFHQRANRLVDERHEHPVDDESRVIERGDRRLAQRSGDFERQCERRLRGVAALGDLHQRHHRYRVEEVHADDPVGPFRGGGHPSDRDRRGVAGEDHLVAADAIEPLEDIPFGLEVFGDRLDHEVGAPGGLERRGRMQPVEGGIAVVGRKLSLLHQAFESLFDVLDAALDQAVIDLTKCHLVAAADSGLRNPGAHQSGAGDKNLIDRHAESLSSSRAITNRWISLVPS